MGSLLYSQTFEGEYISNRTSFKDEFNTENDFIEETDFNILIVPKDGEDGGVVMIQDPRIPDKSLIYSNFDFIGKLKDGDRTLYIYQCKPQHINKGREKIVIYYDDQDKLNLMLSSEESSQVFFDLKKPI